MNEEQIVAEFRTLIQDSDLCCPTSKEVLLAFLRARKYDKERALKLLRNYRKMNQKWPDLHKLRLTNLQKYFDMRTQFIARVKDHKGRRIFVCRIGQWNPSVCSLDDFFHCAIYCFQILAADCETQIKGIAIIFDFNGFALHQARCITPGFAKKMASVLQDSFPLRVQAIHIINEPWIFKMVLSIFWPFLKEKMKKRIYCHGQSYTSLRTQLSSTDLPEDYDALQRSLDSMHLSDFLATEEYIFNMDI